jgi:hypothetical protein
MIWSGEPGYNSRHGPEKRLRRLDFGACDDASPGTDGLVAGALARTASKIFLARIWRAEPTVSRGAGEGRSSGFGAIIWHSSTPRT